MYDLIDSFITLEEAYDIPYPIMKEWASDKWKWCPVCDAKPRVWTFDNGRFAACKCHKKYGDGYIQAVSIGEWVRSHNGSALHYPELELRDNWNKRCVRLNLSEFREESINQLIK